MPIGGLELNLFLTMTEVKKAQNWDFSSVGQSIRLITEVSSVRVTEVPPFIYFRSSVGQSTTLIKWKSVVQIHPEVPIMLV